MACVIGIDGGATTTRGVLADAEGRVLASSSGPGTNIHHAGLESSARLLVDLCHDLLRQGDRDLSDLACICLGLAGVGRAHEREQLLALLAEPLSPSPVHIVTDAEIALSGGCLSTVGILVVAGTGSIIYGSDSSGGTARVGGYGHLLSDEGSGYALGVAGLRAVMRARDGLGMPTPIRERVLSRLGLKDEDDLVCWSMQRGADKAIVAQLAGAVLDSYVEGDPVAAGIVQEAADALALGVERVASQLVFPDRFPVVLSGGLLLHWPAYFDLLNRKIHGLLPGADVMRPRMNPARGAAFLALERACPACSERIVANLCRSSDDRG